MKIKKEMLRKGMQGRLIVKEICKANKLNNKKIINEKEDSYLDFGISSLESDYERKVFKPRKIRFDGRYQ